jgi:hypothetical protein
MQAWRVGNGSTSFELQMGDVKDTWELDLSCIHSIVWAQPTAKLHVGDWEI